MTLKPGDRLGPYEIVAPIGAGGMGEVYRARDLKLARDIALKILPASVSHDGDRASRFMREAQSLAALNHPHIGAIYGLDEARAGDETLPVQFLLLELVEGETLADRVKSRRHKSLEMGEALTIARQVADAIEAAHAKGIIHRDLKPANVMIRADGIVKVLDFGLAKLVEAPAFNATTAGTIEKTAAGTVVGTAGYMSPEQARGEPLDARTDIFSLGVILYEMIAGRSPFEGGSALEVISEILKSDPPPLVAAAPHATPELQRIVGKALKKDREERYQSMKELSLDLKSQQQELEFGAKLKSGPREETSGRAGSPPASRRRTRGLAAAGAALALVVSGVLLWNRSGAAIESVAVLPLVNATNDPEMEYLSDGIAESLINKLSQLPGLKVMSRSSMFRLKAREIDAQEVGRLLNVKAVLTGRVTKRGDSLTVSLELVDARDNSQIWGQQYAGRLADVFALQADMTRDISEKMRLKLTGAEIQQLAKRPTENIKAFQYYMQGRTFAQRRTREDLLEAVRYSEKAIEQDDSYALAYAGLADAYASLGARGYIHPAEGRRQAEAAARKAVALDDRLAEAHVAMSQPFVLFPPYDFPLIDRELNRAVALSPSLAMAHNYLALARNRQGRFDEASAENAKARELDPLSPIIARASSLPFLLKRDYRRARDILRQADELGPQFIIPIEIGVYIQNGLLDEALAGLEKAKRDRPDDNMLLYQTGLVYAAQGRRAEAMDVVKTLEARSGENLSQAHWIAKIHAGLNEPDRAFAWLERGLAVGAIGDFYKDEPVWDPIRGDARFTELLRRMANLP